MGGRHSHERDQYKSHKVIGEGASCRVEAVKHKQTGQMYALKILHKTPANKKMYHNETKILKLLEHPNILELVTSFEDKKSFNLLTVLCEGGELFDKVVKGQFSERVASSLTKQMLLAVKASHEKHVVHRDLKPENFVFETSDEDSVMKLIDFGVARIVADDETLDDMAGSLYYIAPEVIGGRQMTGQMWKAADMWSVGIILYLFVCGTPPFNGRGQTEVFTAVQRGKYKFPRRKKGHHSLSDSVKDLIQHLLVVDPSKRFTVDEALAHPWIAGNTASADIIPHEVIDDIHDFHKRCKLKAAVGRVMTRSMLSEADKENVAKLFNKYDTNGDGKLDHKELANMMKELHWDEGVQEMVERLDENGDGVIDLDELQHAEAVGKLGHASEKELRDAFDAFDLDNDGFVTATEIQTVCEEFMDSQNAKALIKEVDADGDGMINFEEWVNAMHNRLPKGRRNSILQ